MVFKTNKYLLAFSTLLALTIALGVGFWLGASSNAPEPAPTHQNRLSDELSPYLRLHAHNPVDWYPWGPEALAKAKTENKPIFLSVGYSSCYWCHVMERLVFSDPDIAKQMNQLFINIKVDREERPDIDEIYMTATQLIAGHGGWPNSVFLTPDLKPFFAGTYFPPEDSHGRPGFLRVIQTLHVAWQENRAELEKQADEISQAIARIHTTQSQSDSTTQNSDLTATALAHIESRFDSINGGLGTAPKFPPDHALALLLTVYDNAPDPQIHKIITHSLDRIALGGIRDHLGGGFHRYATDAQWRVPHFEKMLYNQAFLVHNYSRAYQITQKTSYRTVAEETLDFISHTMTDSEGGFYSALDAETDAEEGAYYTWHESDIRAILQDQADFFLSCYGLAPMPDSDAQVLYKIASDSALAAQHQLSIEDLKVRLVPLKKNLLQTRAKRSLPLLDDKVITAWNGLMIGAYARAYTVFGRPQDRQAAENAAHFITTKLRNAQGDLLRLYRNGEQKGKAYQEDYAYLIDGLIRLYKATGTQDYLSSAISFTQQMNEKFWDPQDGGYYLTESQQELIVRTKSPYDSALPSGNAVALHALWQLYVITQDQQYKQRATKLTHAFAPLAAKTPGAFLHFIHGTLQSPKQTPIIADSDTLVRVLAQQLPSVDKTIAIDIQLTIAPGWHIQSSAPKEDYLIPTQITLETNDVAINDIHYPAPQTFTFPFSDTPLDVFAETVNIPLSLTYQTPPQDVSFLVTYQACDSTRCLLPQTQRISLNIQ